MGKLQDGCYVKITISLCTDMGCYVNIKNLDHSFRQTKKFNLINSGLMFT